MTFFLLVKDSLSRLSLILLLGLFGAVGVWAKGLDCKYLELHLPVKKTGFLNGDSARTEYPLWLAYPESLGQVDIKFFLEGSEKNATAMVQKADWQAKQLAADEKDFLVGLKDFLNGNFQGAASGFGKAGKYSQGRFNAKSKLKPYLQIDKGLMLLLAGYSNEAENAWMHILRDGIIVDPCAEGAWRNLYSLYLGKRQFDKAHGLVDEILKDAPKNKWANFAKGYLLRMLAPGEEWENFLREKSSWQDSLFEIQIAYGKFLKDKRQYRESAKYYSRGLEGAPNNGPAWLDLAEVYYRQGLMIYAENCIRQSFNFGINDPYIFELYSLILQDGNPNANGGRARWNAAERLLEEGFPHDLHSRSMAQLLYHVYCHNGKIESAKNLRENFWFHFLSPSLISGINLRFGNIPEGNRLRIRLSEISYPLIRHFSQSDFFEPF